MDPIPPIPSRLFFQRNLQINSAISLEWTCVSGIRRSASPADSGGSADSPGEHLSGAAGEGDAAFADGPAHLAFHREAVEGGVLGLGFRFGGAISPLGLGIEDNRVGKAADGERAAAFQSQQGGRLRAEQAQHAAEGHAPLSVQPAQAKAERSFEADDAVGRVFEFNFLFVHGMRRVIGGNGIDHAIENGFDHGVAVGGGAQRRIHFGIGAVKAHVLFSEQEVMRRNLAGDAQAIAPRLADGGERRRR